MKRAQKPPNRWLVLSICCTSLFIVGLDVSGLNLALPSIQTDLRASSSQLQWILDAYTLVIASLLMFSGSLGDRLGRKKIFRIGLVAFGIGSVLCALAPSGPTLIAARMVQAVGGSMLNPVALSIVTTIFTDPRERTRAIGIWGATIGVSMGLGPVIGGVLIEWWGWPAIFWLNVPVVLLALVLATVFIPESRAAVSRTFDAAGQLLVMAMLAGVTFAIIEGRVLGWTSAPVLTALIAGLCCGGALLVVERRVADPLIDPRFFASLPFTGSVLAAVIGFSATSGFLFVNTLYLQSARGLSPLVAGLTTLPMALGVILCSPLSGRLVNSAGPRTPLVLAGALIATSGSLLSQLSLDTDLLILGSAYLAFGAGFGLINAPITNAAVTGMPRAQAGVAAAVTSTSRQVGTALGVAVFGTITFGALPGANNDLAAASHHAWWAMIGCGLAVAAVGWACTTDQARRTSERVREAFGIER